ncbi:hypothetical protein TPHA_0H02650 [Tetrapisispora phaffii CBS 4417]|uniref:Glutathione synthetase n=1 Tax=Tetrapisispora phaffii (strain ATCC 24235 / CBS 4417 / NBRC 1672 / NRRL Y-8282 / UCD 70-5) TaxID=1071381 RepID=G8BWL7_TETPH|nr:hypothetical protein TPHA_0H02650 [Tetrapisispora phaffii CBS 4417]CCE64468.1 hypothetical protein TPHA_0H02650 [Tetrapisispora phaffii CBS 4417]
MSGKYPSFPKLTDEELVNHVIPEMHQWSLANGLVMYPPNFKEEGASTAPTTVFPTPLPRESFEHAVNVQKSYNELYAKIAQDKSNWLREESKKLSKFDVEFTGRLWKTYLKAEGKGIKQKLRLGVFRSDYLIDKERNAIKQVEFNTVSVSFGGLSYKVSQLHEYLNDSGKYSLNNGLKFYDNIPISDSSQKLTEGLATAIKHYDSLKENPIVVFIVQKKERNAFDQRLLEYNLLTNYGIKSRRLILDEVKNSTYMDLESNRLFVKATGEEIGVIYFRSCYSPSDFASEDDWDTRLYLENSYAIKAPDLLTQLSGTKKIQQLLTDKDILKDYIEDKDSLEDLHSTFVKIYPLDDSNLGKQGQKLAFESPNNYVLKPQREGGGNNIYKEDIPVFLQKLDKNDWNAYILMELIQPEPTTQNVLVRGGEYFRESIISELGIFGCVLFNDDDILYNEYSGWLLRSKFNSSNEGGVAAGFGCVDSVVLY